ncbi:hypothetical protein C7M61_004507 [Candidozyma pseudohaemuli]|uniref:Zinc transporter n=1 Tax=Candidozyma pseudohaemuli TaxID=418784 RepID=A0A2P7YHN2_9ASCO|nr:hypothetical protein C7M61_004507 [[Candida] pseudohaemulonii]PSK35471.1 hypothetical protein C7M61_004507 [[Candida] pseudohaemulonii]
MNTPTPAWGTPETRPPLGTIPLGLPAKFEQNRSTPSPSKSPERPFQSRTEAFQSTLPVLAAFPVLIITGRLVVAHEAPHTASCWFLRVLVLIFQALFFLACGGLLVNLEALSAHSSRSSKTLWVALAAIASFFAASAVLPASRTATLYLGLYFSFYTPYTALAFVYDAWSGPAVTTIVGYAILIGSFVLLRKSLLRHFNPFAKHYAVLFGAAAATGVSILVLYGTQLNYLFLLMNLAAGGLLLVLLPEAKLRSPTNMVVVSVFTYSLETFVLRTSPFGVLDAIVSVVLPLGIKVDLLEEFTALPSDTPTAQPHIVTEILSHSDTRAIFNFLLLNTAFMFVQLLYSFRSKSLGLLSDSLHMALDCASLALGLIAGVLSKNPVNANGLYPFGLQNFEILAGFTNGVLLMGISGSIIFEAIGRLFHPVALQQTTELIIVSILGLLVNIVGIFAFNHGHSHGGHSHDHGHSHGHSHSHSHSHGHSHAEADDEPEVNDNMRGIFLHILADTLGSVGVVISTILTTLFKWQGFDPVASIIIAVLIFSTAVPLIKSTGSSLLLQLGEKKEQTVRNALNDITTIKGIKSFTSVRFWPSHSKQIKGYIHIQVYRGESITLLKKQCQDVFAKYKIDVGLQMENDYDLCWCR